MQYLRISSFCILGSLTLVFSSSSLYFAIVSFPFEIFKMKFFTTENSSEQEVL